MLKLLWGKTKFKKVVTLLIDKLKIELIPHSNMKGGWCGCRILEGSLGFQGEGRS